MMQYDSNAIRSAARSALSLAALLTLATALAALAGCDGGGPVGPSDAGTPDTGAGDAPTYYGDIRPILHANCAFCHFEGGIGPFPLLTYEQVTTVGDRVADATADRYMPPYFADNSGECNTYSNYQGLSDDEIATIGAWVEAGMPEGDARIPEPERPALPVLDRDDLVFSTPEYGINTEADDDYRCFVIDPGVTEPAYITAFDIRPGNLSRVHHVIVFQPIDDAEAAAALALDEADPGVGYRCFGSTGVQAFPTATWAPGLGALHMPAGTGMELPPGRPLIVQIHYNLLSGSGETDSTEIAYQLEPVAIPGRPMPIFDMDLNIPPRVADHVEVGERDYTFLFESTGIEQLHIYNLGPHMHDLGTTQRVTLVHEDGSEECLLQLREWDFNWQRQYDLARPIPFRATDRVRIECHFNSMSRDEMTHWGDATTDEMCLNFFYVSL